MSSPDELPLPVVGLSEREAFLVMSEFVWEYVPAGQRPDHAARRYFMNSGDRSSLPDNASGDALIEQVRDLLEDVFRQVDFPGREELVRQASHVKVLGGPMTMLDLRVGDEFPASALPDGPVPLSAAVSDATGASIGELLIWVERGYLSCLESWWTDDPPVQLPAIRNVRVNRR